MLHTEASFSIYNVEDGFEDERKNEEAIERGIIIGEFSFGGKTEMGLVEEEGDEEEGGFGGLNGIQTLSVEGEVGHPIPSNPLALRNYAQLLQSKGDLQRAEEYYFRATQADPEDGDQRRAISYFERAAQAAPDDRPPSSAANLQLLPSFSHILAAYARFLWDTEIEDATSEQDHIQELENLASRECVEATAPDSCNDEENPLFLGNYAKFLQSKGDLQGAEEYYSRAMLADPGDGQIISQYAKLVWELHHDRDKCLQYFERAIQATPGDSNVLAAYASFLWETGEED